MCFRKSSMGYEKNTHSFCFLVWVLPCAIFFPSPVLVSFGIQLYFCVWFSYGAPWHNCELEIADWCDPAGPSARIAVCCLKHCSERVFTSPGFVILVGAQWWFWKQLLWTHSIKLTLELLGRFHGRALLSSVQLTAYLSLPDSAPVRLLCLVAVPATSSSLGEAQFSVWQQRNILGELIKLILGTREAKRKYSCSLCFLTVISRSFWQGF